MTDDCAANSRIFLDPDEFDQDIRDHIAGILGRRRPEPAGHFFDADKIWEFCGSEVDPADQTSLGLDNVTGYLADSGKLYLVWGDGMVDRLKLSPDGDLSLVRDYADRRNRAAAKIERTDITDTSALLELQQLHHDAIDGCVHMSPKEVAEASLLTDKLSAMLRKGFAAGSYGSADNAPTVKMTAKHGDEKVAIVKRPDDTAPTAASNRSGPLAAISTAVKSALKNITEALSQISGKKVLLPTLAIATVAAGIGGGGATYLMSDYVDAIKNQANMTGAIHNFATKSTDVVAYEDGALHIQRDLSTPGALENNASLEGATEEMKWAAQRGAQNLSSFEVGHIASAFADGENIMNAWNDDPDLPRATTVQMTLVSGNGENAMLYANEIVHLEVAKAPSHGYDQTAQASSLETWKTEFSRQLDSHAEAGLLTAADQGADARYAELATDSAATGGSPNSEDSYHRIKVSPDQERVKVSLDQERIGISLDTERKEISLDGLQETIDHEEIDAEFGTMNATMKF